MENLFSHPFVLFLLVCSLMLILPLFLLRNLIRRDLTEDKRREQMEAEFQETRRCIQEQKAPLVSEQAQLGGSSTRSSV
jgi:hypothetical protein